MRYVGKMKIQQYALEETKHLMSCSQRGTTFINMTVIRKH